ncbi:MAG: hemerythrin domain-containing protein [Gammaproteobacteria bacterium]
MADILDRLHQDHIHMAQVLDVLDQQLEILRHPENGYDADLDLIRESAHYFMSFPDKVHHVAEDKLFAKTERVAPDMKPEFEKLRSDHKKLAEEGVRFHQITEQLCAGEVLERSVIVKELAAFLRLQRDHMDLEEGHVFPGARASLNSTNIEEIEAEYSASVDPIFGEKLESYYESIREAIVTADH